MNDDNDDVVGKIEKKATETVTLARWQYTMLIISAIGGIFSILSNGVNLLHEIGVI